MRNLAACLPGLHLAHITILSVRVSANESVSVSLCVLALFAVLYELDRSLCLLMIMAPCESVN